MDECQFYDKKRLEQLHRKEEQLFAEAKDKNHLPNDLTNYEVCCFLPCFVACFVVCLLLGLTLCIGLVLFFGWAF